MTLESLTELATKSGSGRWSAFYAIGAHGSAAAIQVLEDYAFGADPQARMVATEVLGLLPTVDPDIVVRALCDSYGAVARSVQDCGASSPAPSSATAAQPFGQRRNPNACDGCARTWRTRR